MFDACECERSLFVLALSTLDDYSTITPPPRRPTTEHAQRTEGREKGEIEKGETQIKQGGQTTDPLPLSSKYVV